MASAVSREVIEITDLMREHEETLRAWNLNGDDVLYVCEEDEILDVWEIKTNMEKERKPIECSICLSDIDQSPSNPDMKGCMVSCGHLFHYKCISTWSNKQRGCTTCPIDRKAISRPSI